MSEVENEVKNNKEKESTDDTDSRVYEVGYLLIPSITEEELPTQYGNLRELISSLGGAIISDEMPKMIDLAYPMSKVTTNIRSKFSSAYFGWVKFFMDADKIADLKKKLDLDVNVIRFLVLKTVKENTIASKRFIGKDASYRRVPSASKTEDKEEAVPINKEEIDKEIDAMVAV